MFKINLSQKLFLIIFIALVIILITTGFGCKKKTSQKEAAPAPAVSKPIETKPIETKPIETKPAETKPVETEPVESKPVETKPAEPVTPPEENEESLVLKQAEKIAQIFGTYATTDDPPYKNLRDLKDYATPKFASWLNSLIKDQAPSGPFHGWATTALSSVLLESSPDLMKILITCKREEFLRNQRTPNVSYKMLMMNFKKIGEDWKVDRVEWLE